MVLSNGSLAIEFRLQDQAEKNYSFQRVTGKWVFLLFLGDIKSNLSKGLVLELQNMKDEFIYNNIQVIIITSDNAEEYLSFLKENEINIVVLSDPNKRVMNSYDLINKKKKEINSRVIRTGFYIDPLGELKKHNKISVRKNQGVKIQEAFKTLKQKFPYESYFFSMTESFFDTFTERKFPHSEKYVTAMTNIPSDNEYNQGYIQALRGMLISTRSGDERDYINKTTFTKSVIQKERENYISHIKNPISSSWDKGYFSAWLDYLTYLSKDMEKTRKPDDRPPEPEPESE